LRRCGAGCVAISADDVTGDIFASAEYRAAVAPVYVKRAIAAAAARAGLA
jgi:CO/xanthine dehydrogenase FAD-binding subunit